uniref:Extended synaptotagmin-like protein 1a n=1 Tax=Stegastes partitus TaxID=144197 RepID=A0A3B5AN77_9TELE
FKPVKSSGSCAMPAAAAGSGMSGGTATAASASPSQPPAERAVSVLWSFGKCLGALLPVYLAGYYGFSISVVLFGLMIYMGWKHSRLEKVMRLKSAMYLLENEKEFTTEKVFRAKRDLPPWVRTDTSATSQAWPFVGQYLEKLLVETIAPAIRASSIHLQTLSFTKVNIGDKVPEWPVINVVGVKAHTEHDKRQVMLDLYLSYAGDVEINVEIKKYFCKAGVKGIQLHGKLRVILEPLIGDVPLVGAITMFFIRRPKLDINWTGLTNLLDIPGLNAMSDTMIMDAIASFLVLPNRLTVPLVADLHVAQLRSPLPRGVVRIHLLEAEDLTAKDTVIKGLIDGKSDPYAVLRVGTQIFTSHHVDSNLNPQWREMYEVIVHEVPGQELEVEVFDKDPDQDDFLGRVKVDLDIVKKARVVDDWFNLRDVPSGSVHLRLEWLSLLSSADRLSEVRLQQSAECKTAEPPSAAILAVYLDQAHELPVRSKGNKDPSPMVQISIQDSTKESKTCYGTNSPVWEDAFTFFIQDPRKQDIDIQVKDDDRALSLGSLTIPLTRLLGTPDLTMDQWFHLENSGSASRIYVKVVLRVLWLSDDTTPTTPSPRPSASGSGMGHGVIPSELNPMGPGGLAKPPSTRPQHTTPDPEFATEVRMNTEVDSPCESHIESLFLCCAPRFHCKNSPYHSFLSRLLFRIFLPKTTQCKSTHFPICVFNSSDSPNSAGQVKLTIGYSSEENRLFITVHSCRALAACSKDGADPYVSFILLPDKKATTKRRTATKKRDLNPEFNERFDFDFSLEESTQRRLDLSVKNSVSFMSRERELIGKVFIIHQNAAAGWSLVRVPVGAPESFCVFACSPRAAWVLSGFSGFQHSWRLRLIGDSKLSVGVNVSVSKCSW